MIHAAALLPLIGLLPPAAPTTPEDDDVKTVERTGDGKPVCGLGREFHTGRRGELKERLGDSGLFVMRGLPVPRDYLRFTQDKMFWYLTGIESPDVSLVIDLETGEEMLFLPPASTIWETWNGERWDIGDDWIGELTGFKSILPDKALLKTIEERLSEGEVIWTSLQPYVSMTSAYDSARSFRDAREKDPLDGRKSREHTLKERFEERFGVEVKDASPTLNKMRWVKQPQEVEAIHRASRAGAAALVEAIRSTRPGVGEWEIASLMTFVHVREGASGPAYSAIVGSGPNSCSLHYLAAAREMRDGEPLLVDYGPEVDHYVTDITRTWPVGGKFEGRMKELYEAVLAAQEAAIAGAGPGMTLRDVHALAVEELRSRGFAGLLNHGVCHSVGMEVHDPGPRGGVLEPGVVFTIEPGAYDGKLGIGIRIEDVVVCTEDGVEVLSDDVPKDIASIEALMATDGALDLLQDRGQ
ncbi:MAG: Xaa-Pro peptidase family protein [Planctomycetota bacterium]